MRPRNRISDPEQSPEETATISKRGSSQRAAANRARQWLASGESDNDHRQLQSPEQPSTSSSLRARASRMVIPPNGNSNSSTASTTRSPRKTTNSTAGEGSSRSTATRRLRNISQSEPSVTPPPHTVDHNYGEPSSRRSSRNRHQLSRHQRNADELDQTPEEDEDAHTADDTSDDAPLRPRTAPRTSQISSRLRSKTASPAKRSKKSSGTSEEDDGARQDDSDEEFIGVEEESDSEEKITPDSTDDDSDDNTPLRMMSKSRSSRARPPPASRAAGAASGGNISSRTRQKERFSSEDDYGGPGPSTVRNTRNLKRPRYNEDSDDEDVGRAGQSQRPKRPTIAANERPHQYFGGGGPSASRLQRNGDATTTSNTGTDSHSEDYEALTSVSSRGRVRRIKPNVRRIFRE